MSLTVTAELLELTTRDSLESYRQFASGSNADREYTIDTSRIENDALLDIVQAAMKLDDGKTARAAEAIIDARKGMFGKPVPNFKAFQGILEAFLKKDLIDGWIYVEGNDGKLYPQLVTKVEFDDGIHGHRNKATPSVKVHTAFYGLCRGDSRRDDKIGIETRHYSFNPQDVSKRRVADALAKAGMYKETQALKDEYLASMKRHQEITLKAFAKQFRLNGPAYYYEDEDYRRRGQVIANRKVIHDLEPEDYDGFEKHVDSELFATGKDSEGVGPVPEHPVIRLFDLKTHEYYWAHGDFLTPYAYDKSLREKLVLPQSHRDLLDVLTTDLDAFVDDIIEGKSAGNIILCKGIAGVGKTLTAEVYAELIERPLYLIHTGRLGTTADDIDKNLEVIFQRSKRWDCVLLLDEADVFVLQRRENVEQNAIVAEFLRVMEYFDGLFFMTTNRPDDIDDAILSRCAAIIEYDAPDQERAKHVWQVMSDQFEAKLTAEIIAQLVKMFPTITPRDIKMLLRLALRVSISQKQPLDLEVFRRCAMFRAIKIAEDEGKSS